MSLLDRSTLPNVITVGRVLLAPVVAILVFVPSFGARLLAFVLFLVAAVSDLWDGYLARKHGWISDFGKLMDPLADKLLLVATFVPFYILSHRSGPVGPLPIWGVLPLWVLIVVFGRELLITIMRVVAAKRGAVVPAGKSGKWKALSQNIASGAILLWYALQTEAHRARWAGSFWDFWQAFHGVVLALVLLVAVVLTVYSLVVYLWSWRAMVREAA
ncbi:MAG: CDP-diacylglycerol--glycerol-3-phosphate 3-phosphatidyltransferase [Gemmatimonadota bacterium]|jgi:CDP-diacylglycerol--glycerol-3-phosphate 3-phosphatidyltransferase